MYIEDSELERLATRARHGDVGAGAQLRQELEPQMVRIVRRAVRAGGDSPLARRITDAARRAMPLGPPQSADPDGLARRVAHSLCDAVLGQLQPRPPGAPGRCETVRL